MVIPRRVPVSSLVVLVTVVLVATAVTSTPPHAPPAADRTAAAGVTGFAVTATSLVIDGLRIEGGWTAPVSSTTAEPTLNLAADRAVGEELTIAAAITDRTLEVSCPARCRLAGRPVRLQVVELTATPVVAGAALVPVTLSASTPAPALLELVRLPQLTLRDVRARLALITADEVDTAGARVNLLAH